MAKRATCLLGDGDLDQFPSYPSDFFVDLAKLEQKLVTTLSASVITRFLNVLLIGIRHRIHPISNRVPTQSFKISHATTMSRFVISLILKLWSRSSLAMGYGRLAWPAAEPARLQEWK